MEKSFKDNKYNWMGTCKGDAALECSNDGWTNIGTICECENVVTEAQLSAVQDKCDKQAEREFNKAGGDAQQWEEKKTQGAMLVMSSSLKSCFNKQMETKGLSWTGVCQDPVYLNQECKYDRVEMMSKMVKTSTFSGMYCMECTGTTLPGFWKYVCSLFDLWAPFTFFLFLSSPPFPPSTQAPLRQRRSRRLKTLVKTKRENCTKKVVATPTITKRLWGTQRCTPWFPQWPPVSTRC